MSLGGFIVVYKVFGFWFVLMIGNMFDIVFGLLMGKLFEVILNWFVCGEFVDVVIMVGYVLDDLIK